MANFVLFFLECLRDIIIHYNITEAFAIPWLCSALFPDPSDMQVLVLWNFSDTASMLLTIWHTWKSHQRFTAVIHVTHLFMIRLFRNNSILQTLVTQSIINNSELLLSGVANSSFSNLKHTLSNSSHQSCYHAVHDLHLCNTLNQFTIPSLWWSQKP